MLPPQLSRLLQLVQPLLLASTLLAAAPAHSAVVETTPEKFGAKGSPADDTLAIRAAMAFCAGKLPAGTTGCRIVFGGDYLSGPLRINSSSLELRIDGQLSMLPRDLYLKWDANPLGPFLTNVGQQVDLKIHGSGLMAGQGPAWWPCKQSGCPRPHLMTFGAVRGLSIGPLRMQDPANHFIEVSDCEGVRVDSIHAHAPNDSPNTDGINFYGGHDQQFSNSVVHNGDDCVSVVPSGDPASVLCVTQPEKCHGGDLIVKNISCLGGHGISIGSVRHGTITNTTFSNITLTSEPNSTQAVFSSGGECSGMFCHAFVVLVYVPAFSINSDCPLLVTAMGS